MPPRPVSHSAAPDPTWEGRQDATHFTDEKAEAPRRPVAFPGSPVPWPHSKGGGGILFLPKSGRPHKQPPLSHLPSPFPTAPPVPS